MQDQPMASVSGPTRTRGVRSLSHGLIVLILFAGFAIRLPHLAEPPLKFHPTRQYRSAIIARGYYYVRGLTELTPAERNAARVAAAAQRAIEPPVMEHLAAWGYRLAGREALWIPRLMSVIAWTAGGVALWWLAEALLSPPAAVAAVMLFMFMPWGISASQAFQPDPLMVALTVATLAAALLQSQHPGVGSSIFLSGAAAAAVLAKPMAIFFIAPVIVALAIHRRGWSRGLPLVSLWILAISLPAAAYYLYGTDGVFERRFFPQLLRTSEFWQGWAAILDRVVGWPFVLAGLAGIAFSARPARLFLLALWSGYVLFGLVFAYHIHTHDYYSLPFLPIVAVSIGAMVDRVARIAISGSLQRGLVVSCLVALVAGGGLSVRAADVFESSAEVEAEAAGYRRIGQLVKNSARVVSLDGAYGLALNYHGRINSTSWPLSIDLALDRLNGQDEVPAEQRLASLKDVDFFVATDQVELNLQPELRAFLDERLQVAREGPPDHWRFVVYDLHRSGATLQPGRLSLFVHTNDAPGGAQTVHLQTLPTVRWRVEVAAPEIFDVQPSKGTGPATLSIIARQVLFEVDKIVDVAIYTDEGRLPQGTLTVRFKATLPEKSTGPFGFVDSPPDPVVVAAAPVTFSGWALDDIDLRRVWAGYDDDSGTIVPLGDAVRGGMRPDIAKVYPNKHDIFRSAWALTISPEAIARMPDPAVVRFYAENGKGQRAEIGKRAITREK